MAIKFNRSQTFATNGTVTAPSLHNLVDGLDIYQSLITDQTNVTSVSTADELLIAIAAGSTGDAPKAVTVQELFQDALSAGTYTNANISDALSYGTATGTRLVSANATITTGTITTGVIPTLTSSTATFGTTTSTAATITSGTITNLASTTGTIGTINSTTGTIGTIVATGTITGSTNVVNIGSGQIYKDATGNVGIGTTSPDAILTVAKSSTSTSVGSSTAIAKIINSASIALNETSGIEFFNKSVSGSAKLAGVYGLYEGYNVTGYAGALVFATESTGSSNVTERLRIDSSGNVGIGTTSPLGKLKVTVGDLAPAASGDMNTGVVFETNSASRAINVGVNNTAGYSWVNAAFANNSGIPDNLVLMTGANERLRIGSSGNVGIGTTSPANKLEIVGSFGRGAPVTKTADFSLADTENWLIVNKGSSCTVTLPAASSWTGREFTIKTIQAFAVVSASSNIIPRIGGAAATAILPATDGAWATLVSNGTNWEIMCGS